MVDVLCDADFWFFCFSVGLMMSPFVIARWLWR